MKKGDWTRCRHDCAKKRMRSPDILEVAAATAGPLILQGIPSGRPFAAEATVCPWMIPSTKRSTTNSKAAT